MIKASLLTDLGPLVVFGLSHENLRRLKEGQPIRIDMADLGGQGHVVIFAGETETTMQAELADVIGPETKIKGPKQ